MRITDPNLRDLLAGEYVLGTLRGLARHRFERLLAVDRSLQEAVNRWEQVFASLLGSIPPVTPPPRVWEGIERRTKSIVPISSSVDPRLPFWRRLAIAASFAAVTLLAFTLIQTRQRFEPAYVAVLGAPGAQPAWIVSTNADAEQIRVRTLQSPAIRPDQSLELWMLPKGGLPPHSLGVLPDKPGAEIRLSVAQSLQLARAQGLAVSLEPAGGSRQAGPSGPVLYQAKWLPLGETG